MKKLWNLIGPVRTNTLDSESSAVDRSHLLEMCVVRHQCRTSEIGMSHLQKGDRGPLVPKFPNVEHKEHKEALNNRKANHLLSRIGGGKKGRESNLYIDRVQCIPIRAQHKKTKNSQMQKMKAIQTEKKNQA